MAIVIIFSDVLMLNLVLHDVDLTGMISHICRQDHAYDTLTQNFLLVFRKSFDKVIASFEEDPHRLGRMPVLLHSLVVVPQRSVCHEVHVVRVIVAIVVVIVTRGRRDRRHHVEVIQLRQITKVSIFDEHVHTLRYIRSMQVIVILHVSPVPCVNCR